MHWYQKSPTNPNDAVGGGGCVATGAHKGEDCGGDWIVFTRISTEHDASPHAVICAKHLVELSKGYRTQEPMQIGAGDVLPRSGQVKRGTFVSE
jgi:hypothetical protein